MGSATAMGLTLQVHAAERPWLTPGRTAEIRVLVEQPEPCGCLAWRACARPGLTTARDIPAHDDVFVAELDLDVVAALVTMLGVAKAHPLPRFPSIVRDLSILVDESLLAADVRGTIQAVAPPTLVRVAEFDRYQGKGIAEGKVSVSYRLTFQAPDRTLTDAEADAAMAPSSTRWRTGTVPSGDRRYVCPLDWLGAQTSPTGKNERPGVAMVKTATRTVDLAPIDRLEDKVKALVALVERLKGDAARLAEDNARLAREVEGLHTRLSDAETASDEVHRCAKSATSCARAWLNCSNSSKD